MVTVYIQQLMNNTPALLRLIYTRLLSSGLGVHWILESMRVCKPSQLLKNRNQCKMSVLCIPRKCTNQSAFDVAMERVHTVLAGVSLLHCCEMLLYIATLYYQYQAACPRNQNQICHAQ